MLSLRDIVCLEVIVNSLTMFLTISWEYRDVCVNHQTNMISDGSTRLTHGCPCALQPSSVLFLEIPKIIIYTQAVKTAASPETRKARNVALTVLCTRTALHTTLCERTCVQYNTALSATSNVKKIIAHASKRKKAPRVPAAE